MTVIVRYGHENNNKFYIAFTDNDINDIETELNMKREKREIRGYDYFFRADLDQLPYSKTMSEALANMNTTAAKAAQNVHNLDTAVAFFNPYE